MRKRPKGLQARIMAGAIVALVSGVSCSLLVARGATQCVTTQDCVTRGAAFANTICTRDGVCALPNTSSLGGAGGGVSGAGGSAGGDGFGAQGGGVGGSMACTTTKQCVDASGGDPTLCRKGQCVKINSTDCVQVLGDYQNENAIVFGAMTPTSGGKQVTGQSFANTLKLAFHEFQDNLIGGGFPPSNAKQPLVMVLCDEAVDPVRAAAHLTDDLGVKTIVGPSFSDAYLKVAPMTASKRVITLGPDVTALSFLDLRGTGGLAWSCAPNQSLFVNYFASALPILEKRVNQKNSTSSIRVALVVPGDLVSKGWADAVVSKLVFNGKPANQQTSSTFRRFDFDDPDQGALPDYNALGASIAGFQPDIILQPPFKDTVTVVDKTESAWPGSAPHRPTYLLQTKDAPLLQLVAAGSANSMDLRKRLFGVYYQRNNKQLYNGFVSRYQSQYNQTVPDLGSEFAYDCFYVHAFALYAATNAGNISWHNVTGESFTSAIQLLSPTPNSGGTVFDVDPSKIQPIVTTLTNGGHAELTGASSPLVFDIGANYPKSAAELWCIASDNTYLDTGIVFSPTGSMTGSTPPSGCD